MVPRLALMLMVLAAAVSALLDASAVRSDPAPLSAFVVTVKVVASSAEARRREERA
jgi:hypothetical protein